MLSTMSSLGWVSDAYTFSSVATFVAPRRVLTYPLYAGAPLGTCLAPGALRRYAVCASYSRSSSRSKSRMPRPSRRSKSGRSRSRTVATFSSWGGYRLASSGTRCALDLTHASTSSRLSSSSFATSVMGTCLRPRASARSRTSTCAAESSGARGFRSANIFSQSSSAARGATERRLGASDQRRAAAAEFRNDIPAQGNREGPVARATRGARARDGPAGAAREVMSADTC
mmetsp:Transcript_13214/g.55854  ORF Transcript_13214/g.55854 Transcript_13214/m.55854 type:complete len:229 (-) Transcript_13214:49-735(-)